eukprot:15436986-Alexandrium_andersonii.AAC.1
MARRLRPRAKRPPGRAEVRLGGPGLGRVAKRDLAQARVFGRRRQPRPMARVQCRSANLYSPYGRRVDSRCLPMVPPSRPRADGRRLPAVPPSGLRTPLPEDWGELGPELGGSHHGQGRQQECSVDLHAWSDSCSALGLEAQSQGYRLWKSKVRGYLLGKFPR